jgi:outer membrane protein
MNGFGIRSIVKAFLAVVLLCSFALVQEADETGLELIQAVKSALKNNQDIKVEEMTALTGKGVFQEASGEFDPTLSLSIDRVRGYPGYPTSGTDLEELKSTDLLFGITLEKEFRSGITTTLAAMATQNRSYDTDTFNYSNVNFTISVPLLQGRGKSSTGATEKSYKLIYEADKLSLQHTVSAYLKETAQRYWDYVTAVKTVDTYKQAESEANAHLAEVEELIKSSEKFKNASVGQLKALSRSQVASAIAAMQKMREARQSLGILMGISYKYLVALPMPASDFPTMSDSHIRQIIDNLQEYIENALANRADINAYEKYLRSGEVLLKQAKNQTLNQLDLSITLGYVGYNTAENSVAKYFSALWENRSGINSSVGLSYELPINNNTNRGALLQTRAALKTYEIQKFQLKRSISSEINLSISNLKNLSLELQEIKTIKDIYEQEMAKEKIKFKNNESTLVDIVTTQFKLISARLQVLEMKNRIAQEIVNFRYLTSTLIDTDRDGGSSVSEQHLTTLPNLK